MKQYVSRPYVPKTESVSDQYKSFLHDVPRSLFVIVPYPRTHESPSGMVVSSFETMLIHPKPFVSFSILTKAPIYDAIRATNEFAVFPINDPTVAGLFGKTLSPSHPLVLQERMKQERALLECSWHIRCKRSPEHSVRLYGHEIVVGQVIAAIRHEGPALNYAPFYWRRKFHQYWGPDTSKTRFRKTFPHTRQLGTEFNQYMRYKPDESSESRGPVPDIPVTAMGVDDPDPTNEFENRQIQEH